MRLFWLILLFTFFSPVNADENSLTLGIFPYVSTSKLITHNNIIRQHINNTTKYNISLVSSKNIPTYIRNLKEFKYDIVFSAPHLARYIEKNYHYKRIVMTTHDIKGIYISKKESPIAAISDFKGKVVALTSPKTIIHQMAMEHLIENGIDPEKDITIKPVKTFNNAIYDVLNNYSDVAVTGIKIWKKMPGKIKNKLKIISQTKPTAGFMILARPTMKQSTLSAIQSSLLAFNNTPGRKKYVFQGFRLISDADMESLDFHAKIFE